MSIAKTSWNKEDALKTAQVSWKEEAACLTTFFLGVPGAVFVFPIALGLIYFLWGSVPFWMCSSAFISLSFLRADIDEDILTSWPSIAMIRYFSFKGVFSQLLQKDKPYILVAPPHGVRFYIHYGINFSVLHCIYMLLGVPFWKYSNHAQLPNISRFFISRCCCIISS